MLVVFAVMAHPKLVSSDEYVLEMLDFDFVV